MHSLRSVGFTAARDEFNKTSDITKEETTHWLNTLYFLLLHNSGIILYFVKRVCILEDKNLVDIWIYSLAS